MVFPETDNHLLTRIDEVIGGTQETATKEKLEDLKKVIVERVETRQKEAIMYLISTLDIGKYINQEIFESIFAFKKGKGKEEKK